MTNTPNKAFPLVPQNVLDPAAGLNLVIHILDALVQCSVINMVETAPPSGPSDGDMYVVASGATGDWAGHDGDVAYYVEASGTWEFYTAGAQVFLLLNNDDGGFYKYTGSAWVLAAGLPDAPSDGTQYARKDGAWEAVSGGGLVDSVNGASPDSSGNVYVETQRLNGINDQTGTAYTLQTTDVGKDVRCSNAAAVALTVPAYSSSYPWEVGDMIAFSQGDVGAVTATSDGTTVIRAPNGDATTGQYDARVLEYLGSDEWRVW